MLVVSIDNDKWWWWWWRWRRWWWWGGEGAALAASENSPIKRFIQLYCWTRDSWAVWSLSSGSAACGKEDSSYPPPTVGKSSTVSKCSTKPCLIARRYVSTHPQQGSCCIIIPDMGEKGSMYQTWVCTGNPFLVCATLPLKTGSAKRDSIIWMLQWPRSAQVESTMAKVENASRMNG